MNVYPQTTDDDESPQSPCAGVSRRGSTKSCVPRVRPPYGPPPARTRAADLGYAWTADGLRLVVPVSVTHPGNEDLVAEHWAEIGADNALFGDFLRWASPHPRWPEAGHGFEQG